MKNKVIEVWVVYKLQTIGIMFAFSSEQKAKDWIENEANKVFPNQRFGYTGLQLE